MIETAIGVAILVQVQISYTTPAVDSI